MKIDYPLYCPSFNDVEWGSLYCMETQNNAKLLSFSPSPFSLCLFLYLSLTLMIKMMATLFVGLVCHAADPSGHEYRNLTRSHRTCMENEQYPHQGHCCLNCQAGR